MFRTRSPFARRKRSALDSFVVEDGRIEDQVKYELWRMDDNGNRFLIGVFDSQAEALDEARAFEAKGHKQTYWVEPQSS